MFKYFVSFVCQKGSNQYTGSAQIKYPKIVKNFKDIRKIKEQIEPTIEGYDVCILNYQLMGRVK